MIYKMKNKNPINYKDLFKEYGIAFLAGVLVAFGLYYFTQFNNFVPGGIGGVSFILSWELSKVNAIFSNPGIFLFALNIPLCVLVSIFLDKKLGFNIAFYVIVQTVCLYLFEELNFPYFHAEVYKPEYIANDGSLIFAAIGAGVITGLGYGLQVRYNGSSGGTYSISALIKHWNPAANMPQLSFIMDTSVVLLVFFILDGEVAHTIATILNVFISNYVVDYCLQGSKSGYKFEIITDSPEELSSEIMATLKHGVTELNVQGMYTHQSRYMIVCIIRQRELSKMMKILKKYKSFSSFTKVNEVIGNFKK